MSHLSRSTGLQPEACERVVEDVLAYFAEPAETFVRRRHRELQSDGLANAAIFPAVAGELQTRCVQPPSLSDRQLRRMVYG